MNLKYQCCTIIIKLVVFDQNSHSAYLSTSNIHLFTQPWRIDIQFLVTNSWLRCFVLRDGSYVSREIIAYTPVALADALIIGWDQRMIWRTATM